MSWNSTSSPPTSELAPNNLELAVESSLELAPCEQSQRGEVNMTQPPPQLSDTTDPTPATVDGPSSQLFEERGVTYKQE